MAERMLLVVNQDQNNMHLAAMELRDCRLLEKKVCDRVDYRNVSGRNEFQELLKIAVHFNICDALDSDVLRLRHGLGSVGRTLGRLAFGISSRHSMDRFSCN